MTKQKKNIFGFLLLIILIITYSNHFNNGFHFDDSHMIVSNPSIRNIKNIPEFFVNTKMISSSKDHRGLRPIVTTTLAIDYWLGGGLDPFYFHLSTFLFFIGLLIMIFFMYEHILYKSIKNHYATIIALISVAWYSFHPANAETINYIISRTDVISTFFILASFSLYIFFPNKRKKYFYIIPAMIGVFAKETLIVLPMLLFVYIIFFEKKLSIPEIFKKKNLNVFFNTILKLFPLIIVIIIVQSYTLIKTGSIAGLSSNIFHYIQTQPYVWLHYFYTLFLPLNLSADSDWVVIKNLFDYRVVHGFVFLFTLIFVIIKTSKKQETRPISFGLIWFMFALLPTSLAPLAEVMNDHRMFFPFIGLGFSITYCISYYLLKIKKTKKSSYFLYTSILLILFCYAYGTYQRNKVWLNGERLWYDVTIKSPNNGRGLMNYGLTQMRKGNYINALNYFNKSLKLYPNYSTLHVNLGIANGAINKNSIAKKHFNKAISLKPEDDVAYFFYAKYLRKNNNLQAAKKNSLKALNINPFNLGNRHLLMNIYSDLELKDDLLELVNATLKTLPNDSISLKFKEMIINNKSKLTIAKEAAEINPTAAKYLNLGVLYYNKGQYQNCIKYSYKALELDSKYVLAYNNICSSYNALGRYQDAIINCKKALSIDSKHVLAKNNLNQAINNYKRNKVK